VKRDTKVLIAKKHLSVCIGPNERRHCINVYRWPSFSDGRTVTVIVFCKPKPNIKGKLKYFWYRYIHQDCSWTCSHIKEHKPVSTCPHPIKWYRIG